MTKQNSEDDIDNPTIPDISTKLSSVSHTGSTGTNSAKHHPAPTISSSSSQPPPSSLGHPKQQETANVAFVNVDAITMNATTLQLTKSDVSSPDPELECKSSVEIVHHEDKQPEISKFHDHFTLLIPSSTIR